ncbi:MAG: DNA repair protein RecO [Endomicrobium sp.]|jgi:DNA repair protein RecO (recombination protein O)|nr:DNA repair protein RecO [Endomicrobium sp.]
MYYTIKGIVLNSKVQGEQDKLVTIYSYEWGKFQAVVPSAKKIAAKLSSATELLTESEFMIFNNGFHSKIVGAKIIENNSKMKRDFKKNLYALYATEICDRFVPYNMENRDKYSLIIRLWQVLSDCSHQKRAFTAFVLRFLKISGYSFLDYIKNDGVLIDKNVVKSIKRLSNCSGNDIDTLEAIEDDKVWDYVESYLTKYISRPSLSVFLQKIETAEKTLVL